MGVDLGEVWIRYQTALDAKPSKGDISPEGIVAITDSVCDVPELVKEIERLREEVYRLNGELAKEAVDSLGLAENPQRTHEWDFDKMREQAEFYLNEAHTADMYIRPAGLLAVLDELAWAKRFYRVEMAYAAIAEAKERMAPGLAAIAAVERVRQLIGPRDKVWVATGTKIARVTSEHKGFTQTESMVRVADVEEALRGVGLDDGPA